MPSDSKIPKSFRPSVDSDHHVQKILSLVPRPPDGYPKARAALRAAEWEFFAATSVEQAEKVSRIRTMIRDYAIIEKDPGGLPALLETEMEILAAVGADETARLQRRADRVARRKVLERARAALIDADVRGERVSEEMVAAVLECEETVAADDAAVAEERAVIEALIAAVADARANLVAILIDACQTQVAMAAKDFAGAVEPKVALWLAYPKNAPRNAFAALMRSDSAFSAAKDLAAVEIDVDAEYTKRLSVQGRALFRVLTGRHEPMSMEMKIATR
jgi:hypothetical protein